MPCSWCGQNGHNVRTCMELHEVDFIPLTPEIFDQQQRMDDVHIIESDLSDDVHMIDPDLSDDVHMIDPDYELSDEDVNEGILSVYVTEYGLSDDETVVYESEDAAPLNNKIPVEELVGILYDCPVCMETLSETTHGVVNLPCSHKYCPTCFVTHMRIANTCAMCRTTVCQKPSTSAKKTLSDSAMVESVRSNISNQNLVVSEIRKKIISSAKHRLVEIQKLSGTEYSISDILDICIDKRDIHNTMLLGGITCAEDIADWYDVERVHDDIRVDWGSTSFTV